MKSYDFYKMCLFLGKMLLLIHSHFTPVILLHPDEDNKFFLASTKYELDPRNVR